MSKNFREAGFRNIILMFVIGFSCFTNIASASDNVLQAIQVDGVKDSYNIILKSDDVAELKKTVQAPNKIILNLKGIRASKTINTIYNNTSSVDSVVVEPNGEDNVKILIQATNASNAEIHFDTLKTPLGVLSNSEQKNKSTDELVLNGPIKSYKPVYNDKNVEAETGITMAKTLRFLSKNLKNILGNEKLSWMITFGLLAIFLLSGIKLIKGKDNEIKVGLTQSLRDREIELYRNLGTNEINAQALNSNSGMVNQNITGSNYGLRAYQQGTRSQYVSSEIQHSRPNIVPPVNSVNLEQKTSRSINSNALSQNQTQSKPLTMQNTIQKTVPVNTKAKTANIDSMKFLDSMTKIYEKSGRSDLAQGLKTNIKKAKVGLA